MIPGSDLLEDAFEAIDTLELQYLRFVNRATNDIGQWVSEYADPVTVDASIQAVNRQTYVDLGLDWQKDYIYVYASINATDIDRDVTGDRFILPDSRIYQIESQVDWFMMDGWVGVLCVKVDIL